MEHFENCDIVNLMVGFCNNNGIITKENCFFKPHIIINQYKDDSRGVFYTESIKDIKPVNIRGYIPMSGYSFNYSILMNMSVQFNSGYNAMVYISKDSYFDMKITFFNELIADAEQKIINLEKEIKLNQKQIEIYKNMKSYNNEYYKDR